MPKKRWEVSETSRKYREIAEKNLDPGDEIEKIYPGELDGERGYIIMSDNKLMFVHEEGFLRKNYELTLDLPYESIGEIYCEGKYELDFTDIKGEKHIFKPYDMSIKYVYETLKKLAHKPDD
jgi:hypothetical protein